MKALIKVFALRHSKPIWKASDYLQETSLLERAIARDSGG
jgi:hypothetical protein